MIGIAISLLLLHIIIFTFVEKIDREKQITLEEVRPIKSDLINEEEYAQIEWKVQNVLMTS